MNIAYFEDEAVAQLHPLTWIRSAFELCCGCDLLIDKVRRHTGGQVAELLMRPWLQPLVAERGYLAAADPRDDWCLLNARTLIVRQTQLPQPGVVWRQGGELVAVGLTGAQKAALDPAVLGDAGRCDEWVASLRPEATPEAVRLIHHPWDLVLNNDAELRRQWRGSGERAGQVFAGAHLVDPLHVHIARGARVKPGAVLDAENGPIYLAEDVLIEPNAVLQGPCYVGPKSIVRPGAVIKAGTTIGPVCRVGGEIDTTIIHGFSNKQHDGFLGHSYLGTWVNLGADTVTSNVKNTYGTIRVSINGQGVETGKHFVGSIIGDHAKTGIGSILPTGCVIGVMASLFTHRSAPRFLPSFGWLTDEGLVPTRIEKALQIAEVVMARRDQSLSMSEKRVLETVAERAREVEAAGWPK